MKLYPFRSAQVRAVSHDPQLKKRLFTEESISCIGNLSHIKLPPGSTARAHSHTGAYECFFCIRGRMVFSFGPREVTIGPGDLLVAEPGEMHAITGVIEETELFYFFASTGGETTQGKEGKDG